MEKKDSAKASAPRKMPPRLRPAAKPLYLLVVLVFSLVLLEVGARCIFAVRVGPSVLLYGTRFHRKTVENSNRTRFIVGVPDNRQVIYAKYYPNQVRRDYDRDFGEFFSVDINNHGFRGEDFTIAKAPGVKRVTTLGASSTFGFGSPDLETYPYHIEVLLNEACERYLYEVINLGIPHLESDQVLSLLLNEGLALEPDVVTFYGGHNDAVEAKQFSDDLSLLGRLSERFLTLALIVDLSRKYFDRDQILDLKTYGDAKRKRFLASLDKMRTVTEQNGARFIVATQQVTSLTYKRDQLRGLSYADEVSRIRALHAERGTLRKRELKFLTHALLMDDLRDWASQRGTPLVDGIHHLDANRDVLTSKVHLAPRGNRMLARGFADEILQQTCQTE